VPSFSSRSRPATSPETIVVLFQSADRSELDTTYFGWPLKNAANWSSGSWLGQKAAHSS
jgi:hypothetical protein